MNPETISPELCPREASLLAALANGALTDEQAAHLQECAACRDTKLVWSYLNECAAAAERVEIAPAESIWWRAQIEKKRAEARRSVVFIDRMQKIAFAIAAMIVAGLAWWQSPKLLEVSPMLLGATAAIVLLLGGSIAVVLGMERDSARRSLPRGV